MTFENFIETIQNRYDEQVFELRYGQTVMNVLYLVWPEKYNEITGTTFDCFYDDGIVAILLDKLNKEWPK